MPFGRRFIRHAALPEAPPPFALSQNMVAWARELAGVSEAARLAGWSPWLARAPKGDGRLVVTIPGFRSPDVVMQPLTLYLRYLGYSARTWGRGWNAGRVETDVREMMPVLERWVAEHGRPATLVGWSLGGVISRELARELPHAVEQVVTYGTPVVGGPTWTAAADLYGRQACARQAARSLEREHQRPLTLPITAIYTRADGIVSWPACIDRLSPNVTHVEVRSTHVGLGIDPDVWWSIARALQQPVPKPPPPRASDHALDP